MATETNAAPKRIPKTYKTVLSGGIAGMIAKTCTAPLERIQMLNQTGAAHDSIYGTFQRILQNGGTRALWRGNLVNCCRVFPHKSILFGLNDKLQQYVPPNSSSFVSFLTGGISGVAATTIIYPITVIRANLSGTFDKTNSVFGVTKNIFISKGIRGLYNGLMVTCIGTMPHEATRIGVYSVLREYLPTIDTKYGTQPHPVGKLCIGAIAGACAAIATYPTDTVRRMLQVQSAEGMVKYDGLLHCIKYNYKEGGIKRFYFGLNAKLLRIIPDSAILFLAYETLKDFFHDIYISK